MGWAYSAGPDGYAGTADDTTGSTEDGFASPFDPRQMLFEGIPVARIATMLSHGATDDRVTAARWMGLIAEGEVRHAWSLGTVVAPMGKREELSGPRVEYAVAKLRKGLSSADSRVRLACIDSLALLGEHAGAARDRIRWLAAHARSETVREAARQALVMLQW